MLRERRRVSTMPLELVLESLPARTDRPARIPVPSPPGVLFIRRMTPTAMAAANSTPTLWLNADDTSNHPQLLSRAHAELGWVSGVCTLFDGNPRDQKKSCNGSSVDGILVPLGGSAPVKVGALIDFGAPQLLPKIPGRKRSDAKPMEFLYRLVEIAPPPTTNGAASSSNGAARSSSAANGKRPAAPTVKEEADVEERPSRRPRTRGAPSSEPPPPPKSEAPPPPAAALRPPTDAAGREAAQEQLQEAIECCGTSLTEDLKLDELILGGVPGVRSTIGNSLDNLVGSLLSSSSSAAGASESLFADTQDESDAGNGGPKPPPRSSQPQRLLQLMLSRLGFAPPDELVRRTFGALLPPPAVDGTDATAALQRALGAAATTRAHAHIAIDFCDGVDAPRPSQPPPCAPDGLLTAWLKAGAAALRCGSGDSAANACLTVLFNLLTSIPVLSPDQPPGGDLSCVNAALDVFDASAWAEAGSSSDDPKPDVALQRAACCLAARTLACAATEFGGFHDFVMGEIRKRIKDGDALELRARELMLDSLDTLTKDGVPEGKKRLVQSILDASLRRTRFSNVEDDSLPMRLRVLKARPLDADAWKELGILARHALQPLVRKGELSNDHAFQVELEKLQKGGKYVEYLEKSVRRLGGSVGEYAGVTVLIKL